jgi:hypothetical protein
LDLILEEKNIQLNSFLVENRVELHSTKLLMIAKPLQLRQHDGLGYGPHHKAAPAPQTLMAHPYLWLSLYLVNQLYVE